MADNKNNPAVEEAEDFITLEFDDGTEVECLHLRLQGSQ